MDEDTSYFDSAQARQESVQSAVLKKTGRTAELPHELADAAHAHASRFFKEVGDSFETACEKGCSYCCHQPATVFPFEAIRIARVLTSTLSPEALESLKAKMQDRVKGFQGSSVRKNINNKTACPLLAGEQCSVYENRPLTCRMAHSFSVKRCRLSFQKDRFQVQIPISLEIQTGIGGIIEGAFKQLPREKLDGNLYELCSAVLAALADPEAALKWARGDLRVFKDCIKDDT